MLNAAMDLFVDRGYEHVTVEQIARAAGQSKGAFYWYFKDKEDCLQQIVRGWAQKMDIALTQAITNRDTRSRERLLSISDFRKWSDQDFQRFVMLLNGMVHSRSSTVREMALNMAGDWARNGFTMIRQLAQESAREAGWTPQQLAKFDFDAWTLCYISCYNGLYQMLSRGIGGTNMTPDRIADAIHAFFIHPVVAREELEQRQKAAQ
ncbi:MAG: TetR/AcrR family transcriptional regulator [Planctomycetota bacterium]|nr:TetR/AcrR family transcriptional regulator [Planctomycetota bacterium]